MSGRIRTKLVAGIIAATALISAVALAQEPFVATLDPLSRVLTSFTSGEEIPDVTEAGTGNVTGQFQSVIHFSDGWAFGPEGGELVARGYDSSGTLEDLTDIHGENPVVLPPLAPDAGLDGVLMPADLGFDDWELFGDVGATDAIDVGETPTVVWGLELAEPFDTTCASPRSVGRTWTGVHLGDDDPLFTADELTRAYGASHTPLEGQYSRIARLACDGGGEPFAQYQRMSDETGIRNLRPNRITAAVSGNHVIFFMPLRHVDEELYGATFADDGAGGDITLSEWNTDPVMLLVPNPYEDLPIRIELRINPVDAFRPSGESQNLVFTPGSAQFILTGTDCAPEGDVIYSAPFAADTPVVAYWVAAHSSGGLFGVLDDVITIEQENDFGGTDTIVIDTVKGTFTVFRTVGDDGPAEEACEGEGTATFSGEGAPTSGGGSSDDGETEPSVVEDSDSDGATQNPPPTSGGDDGGGPPVVAIIVGAVAIVGGVAYIRNRGRGNCQPEELAHTQALHVAEAAKRVLEEKEAARSAAASAVIPLRGQMQRLDIPGPIKPYPFEGEARARYERELAEYEAEQATREQVEADLANAEQELADATAERDHASARYDSAVEAMWAAYHALRECRERNGGSMPPPPDLGDVELGGDPGHPGSGGGSQPGGGESGGGEDEPSGCTPGTTDWKTEKRETFTKPGGISFRSSRGGAAWAGYISGQGGTIAPSVFVALDDEVDDLSADVDTGEGVLGDHAVATATLEIVEITARCERLWECNPQTGEMEATDTVRVRQEQEVRTETIRADGPVADSGRMAAFVRQLQDIVQGHLDSEAEFQNFSCD